MIRSSFRRRWPTNTSVKVQQFSSAKSGIFRIDELTMFKRKSSAGHGSIYYVWVRWKSSVVAMYSSFTICAPVLLSSFGFAFFVWYSARKKWGTTWEQSTCMLIRWQFLWWTLSITPLTKEEERWWSKEWRLVWWRHWCLIVTEATINNLSIDPRLIVMRVATKEYLVSYIEYERKIIYYTSLTIEFHHGHASSDSDSFASWSRWRFRDCSWTSCVLVSHYSMTTL